MNSKFFLSVVIFAILILASCSDDQVLNTDVGDTIKQEHSQNANFIPNQYIVVLKNDALKNIDARYVNQDNYDQLKQEFQSEVHGFLYEKRIQITQPNEVFIKVLKGFSATLTPSELLALQGDRRVDFIEQEQVITVEGNQSLAVSCADNLSEIVPCGVTKVQGGMPYTGGKKAFIIDTGIDLNHVDLHVSNSLKFNAFKTGLEKGKPQDLHGHGTHVAGIVGAIANNNKGVVGVAAGVELVAVKVLNKYGSGSLAGVVSGIDYVASHGEAGDVANMSLGGGISSTLDLAVFNASSNGIWFTLAAGNSASDANFTSPARINGPYILTISAANCSGNFASFSNWGNPPVDFAAPGVNVCSTYLNNGYISFSGTSMAAPHAAGVLLQTNGAPQSCDQVTNDPDGNPDNLICIY